MKGRLNYENSIEGNQMVKCLMNEFDKLPYSVQYSADYDCFSVFYLLKRGRIRIRPLLGPTPANEKFL